MIRIDRYPDINILKINDEKKNFTPTLTYFSTVFTRDFISNPYFYTNYIKFANKKLFSTSGVCADHKPNADLEYLTDYAKNNPKLEWKTARSFTTPMHNIGDFSKNEFTIKSLLTISEYEKKLWFSWKSF